MTTFSMWRKLEELGHHSGRLHKGIRTSCWTGDLMEGQALGLMPTLSSTEAGEEDTSSRCSSQGESKEDHMPQRSSRTREHLADLHQDSRAVLALRVCPAWTKTTGSFCFPPTTAEQAGYQPHSKPCSCSKLPGGLQNIKRFWNSCTRWW